MTKTKEYEEPYFIWVGAGEAKNSLFLESFLKIFPNGNVKILEARESCVKKLRKRFYNKINVEIVCSAVDINGGEKEFYFMEVKHKTQLDYKALVMTMKITHQLENG